MSVEVQVEVVIDRPVAEVASFASDPGNAPQWYANIASVSWQTTPPASVGSRMAPMMEWAMRRATTKDLARLKALLERRTDLPARQGQD